MSLRHLVVVGGDYLEPESLALEGFDANRDLAWKAELPGESEHDALDAEIASRRPQCLVVV